MERVRWGPGLGVVQRSGQASWGDGETAGQRKPSWGLGDTCPSSQEACGATAVCLKAGAAVPSRDPA